MFQGNGKRVRSFVGGLSDNVFMPRCKSSILSLGIGRRILIPQSVETLRFEEVAEEGLHSKHSGGDAGVVNVFNLLTGESISYSLRDA